MKHKFVYIYLKLKMSMEYIKLTAETSWRIILLAAQTK